MTVPLSLPRLGRPAVAAAASIALTATALLAPHAASAHAGSPASPQFCVSAPVSDLASWGYAVQRTGTSGWGYYAAGSNDDLGSSGSAIKSLAKRSVGMWTRVPLCS